MHYSDLAEYFSSDKQIHDEDGIKLCNYTTVYHHDTHSGEISLHNISIKNDKIWVEDADYCFDDEWFNENGFNGTSHNIKLLFPPTKNTYNALVSLYGEDNVEPLPVTKTHHENISDLLAKQTEVLCVAQFNDDTVDLYAITFITKFKDGMYYSFDDRIYNNAIPIDSRGNIIYNTK